MRGAMTGCLAAATTTTSSMAISAQKHNAQTPNATHLVHKVAERTVKSRLHAYVYQDGPAQTVKFRRATPPHVKMTESAPRICGRPMDTSVSV